MSGLVLPLAAFLLLWSMGIYLQLLDPELRWRQRVLPFALSMVLATGGLALVVQVR